MNSSTHSSACVEFIFEIRNKQEYNGFNEWKTDKRICYYSSIFLKSNRK